MSPLVTTAVGALTTIATVGGFLVAHAAVIKSHIAAIKKEFAMVRPEIQQFIDAVTAFEAAVTARLAQPAPLSPEEVAALADANAKVVAATAAVG